MDEYGSGRQRNLMYIPDKGDIVSLNFDPSSGHEITKHRPAIIVSRKIFNQHTGFAIVAPITSAKRGGKLEVVLNNTATQGVVLVYQLRSLDVKSRDIKLIETAPSAIIEHITKLAAVIIQ